MEKRSRRRIRDLVTHMAFQGLVANEIGCVRTSMMAGNKRSLKRAEYRGTWVGWREGSPVVTSRLPNETLIDRLCAEAEFVATAEIKMKS